MNKRKKKRIVEGLISLLVVSALTLVGWYYSDNRDILETFENKQTEKIQSEITVEGNLDIYFFDVGQADCILLKNAGQTLLIDAGNNADGKWIVGKLKSMGITKLDYVIGTHPHEDHIGGLDDIIENFEIGTIYMPKVQTNTKTFEDVLDAIAKKGLKITTPQVGMEFKVGEVSCKMMACGSGKKEEKDNLNLASIIVRSTYGNQSYLFMGDAEIENELSHTWEQTNVIKIGHHGSNTSSSIEFLKQVKPQIAVICVGEDNKYHHPDKEIVERLESIYAQVYRTDEKGTIHLSSNGEINTIETEK